MIWNRMLMKQLNLSVFIDLFFLFLTHVKNSAFIVNLKISSSIQFFIPLRLTNEKLREREKKKTYKVKNKRLDDFVRGKNIKRSNSLFTYHQVHDRSFIGIMDRARNEIRENNRVFTIKISHFPSLQDLRNILFIHRSQRFEKLFSRKFLTLINKIKNTYDNYHQIFINKYK